MTIKISLIAVVLCAASKANAAPWSLSVVDENGKPIQARVRIAPAREAEEPQILQTDAAGRAKGDLKPRWSDYLGRVFIFAPGHAPAGGVLHSGDNRAKLDAPRSITGRVTDDAGKPLPNVAVQMSNVIRDHLSSEKLTLENSVDFYLLPSENALFSARTDADGRYEIQDVPKRGRAVITVRDVLWQSSSVRVDLLNETKAADLKTRPAARLSGRVLRQDGTPLSHQTVHASSEGNYASAETDAQGRYLLGGLADGKLTIRAIETPRNASGVSPLVEAVAVVGAQTPVPDIHLTQGALIEIKFTPAVSGGQFDLRREDSSINEGGFGSEADNGLIRARVRPGAYRLTISQVPKDWIAPRDWPADGLKIQASEGQTATSEIRLAPALTLHGIARDEAGKPLGGVRFNEPRDGSAVLTDAQGRFTLHDLAPGEVRLSSGPQWDIVKPKKVTLPVAQPVEVTLKKVVLAPLRGRVVDDKGGPVENADVIVEWLVPYDDDGAYSTHRLARSDANGRYEISDVRADSRVTIQASKPKHRFAGGGALTIERTIFAVNGAPIPNPNPAFAASDMVLLPLQREVSGRVLDAQGKPLPNALVAALGGGQNEYAVGPRNITRTDAQGRFKLGDLPEGDLGFVAGAGDGFALIRSNGSELPDIVLQPQARATRDLPLAREIVMNLVATTNDNQYARFSLPNTLAPYDFEAAREAANALRPDGKAKPETLRALMSRWIRSNPEAARAALPALLLELEGDANNIWFLSFVVDVSRLLEQPEKETVADETADAALLRAWVRRGFAQERDKVAALNLEKLSDLETAYRLMHLAQLSARLGEEDADQWAKSAVQVAVRFDAQEKKRGDFVPAVIEGLAEGGTALVEGTLDVIPPQQRAYALGRAIPVLARIDLAGARRLLDLLPGQVKPENVGVSNADPQWAFGLAAKAVIRRMDVEDAAAALTLARRVTAEYHRAEALALAARLQPKAEAAALWREAFDLASAYESNRQEADIVRIALATDVAVGEELLAKLEESFFDPQRWSRGIPPSIPGVYIAQTEPGRARVLFEWEWASAQNTVGGINGPGELQGIAMAMSAVDTKRALEMAEAIPSQRTPDGVENFRSRWEAQRKIAQFLAAPESVRRSLNFNRWSASDTWTLGDDTGW